MEDWVKTVFRETNMLMRTSVLCLIVIYFAGCGNNHYGQAGQTSLTQDGLKEQAGILSAYLDKMAAPIQQFKISSGRPSSIRGKKGTVLMIDPADLVTEDGKPLSKEINVALKELSNQAEMAMNGSQTVADGKLLVSGGAYYIGLSSAGSKLKLKPGKSMHFPKAG